MCEENLLIKNNDNKKNAIKKTTNISKGIILYSTIGNKITIDKKDANVPDGINLIYPANIIDKKLKSAFGVILDDLIAGIYTIIILFILNAFY